MSGLTTLIMVCHKAEFALINQTLTRTYKPDGHVRTNLAEQWARAILPGCSLVSLTGPLLLVKQFTLKAISRLSSFQYAGPPSYVVLAIWGCVIVHCRLYKNAKIFIERISTQLVSANLR